jgi:hypothetical protein
MPQTLLIPRNSPLAHPFFEGMATNLFLAIVMEAFLTRFGHTELTHRSVVKSMAAEIAFCGMKITVLAGFANPVGT